jgi:3-phosphoshikimate 1-carboxyvinyltransferase
MLAKQIDLPLSKSLLNRALIAIAAQGNLSIWLDENAKIVNNGCRDTRLLIAALNAKQANNHSEHYFQDAGTPSRLFTAFAAAHFTGPCKIIGNTSLNSRSIEPLVSALTAMGADIQYCDQIGFTPILIRQGIKAWTDVRISASVSSQYTSALLLIAPLFPGTKKITIVDGTHSQAYIDMTVDFLNRIDIETNNVSSDTERCITIHGEYHNSNKTIHSNLLESDWSSAAFFYPLLLGMPNDIAFELLGLRMSNSMGDAKRNISELDSDDPIGEAELATNEQSFQGDAELHNLGTYLGINSKKTDNGILISRNPRVTEGIVSPMTMQLTNEEILQRSDTLRINLKNNPDLVPALVVGWCILGKSVIIGGIHNLRYKECDRISALQDNIKALGCSLTQVGEELEDQWVLNCSDRYFPAQCHINTQSDHRIAMAFSALKPWIEALSFTDAECVEKSFPQFWEQLKKCTFE